MREGGGVLLTRSASSDIFADTAAEQCGLLSNIPGRERVWICVCIGRVSE